MANRVNELSEETIDEWVIFFVEKEKQEKLKRPKDFKVYQKDKDKGKGKVGGIPNIKVTDNLPPPSITLSIQIDATTDTKAMETRHEDTNPESKIMYTMNIDTQKVNIVVDKETTDEKKYVATKPPTENVEVETHGEQIVKHIQIGMVTDTIDANIEKPTDGILTVENTKKPTESLVVDSVEVHTKKSTVDTTKKPSKKPTVESTMKPTEK